MRSAPAVTTELVDDGNGVGGQSFPDGTHRVGDDPAVFVGDTGLVTILYQDATAGTLRVAKGAPNGATHRWTLTTIAQPGRFAGFFPRFVPGEPLFANAWRTAGSTGLAGDVAFVAP
jgi:hypothetical protein